MPHSDQQHVIEPDSPTAMDQRNWPVPHNVRLQSQLEVGQIVGVRGTIFAVEPKEGNYVVTINFAASGDGYDAATIPFHVSIRLSTKEVIFNTKENNEWGAEQKEKPKFAAGEPFDIRIRLQENHFELMANGVDWTTYKYRLPIQQITNLFIDGPISLEGVNWGGKHYPNPFETGISGGFGPGKRLFISGEVDKSPDRFAVNLTTRSGDIALHFNPRFKAKEVVRNTKAGGEWQAEEKEGGFPFQKAHVFDLLIECDSDAFKIFVNREQLCTYAHRVPADQITNVEVEGALEVQSVQIT